LLAYSGKRYDEGISVMELSMRTLKRLLLAASMCCLVATANAAPFDDAVAARNRGDYAQALKIFRPLAAQGDASAQLNLGVMYAEGQGVPQDYKEAVKWFRLAAAQGNAQAQSTLGNMYAEGWGVIQDYASAHMWYNLASSAGHADGAKNRDLLAKKMTPQQIEKAQDMARACQARNFKGC
jgi:TPR repeat protein